VRIRVHYNKYTVSQGLPWSLHTSQACFQASHIEFKVPVETEEKPNLKTNPRYFIKAEGTITWDGTKAIIIA